MRDRGEPAAVEVRLVDRHRVERQHASLAKLHTSDLGATGAMGLIALRGGELPIGRP